MFDPSRFALGLDPCVPIGTCIGGKVKDANGDCVCPDGSKEDTEGNCVKIGDTKECKGGKVDDGNGNCVCPEGSKEDADGKCQPTGSEECKGGKVKDAKGNCACPEGSKEDADGNCSPTGGTDKCDSDETQSGDMCYGRCANGTTYTRKVGGVRPCTDIEECAPGQVRNALGKCEDPPFKPFDPGTGGCPKGYKPNEMLDALGFQVCEKIEDETKKEDVECGQGFQKSPSGKGCIPEGKIVEKNSDGTCPKGTRQIGAYGAEDSNYCLEIGDLTSTNGGGGGLPVGSTTKDGGVVLPGGWTKLCAIKRADGSVTGYKTVDIADKCPEMTVEGVVIENYAGGAIMSKRKKKSKYATGGIAGLNSGAINLTDGYNFGFAQGGMTDSARERIDLIEYLNTPAATKYDDPYARMEVKSSQTTPAQTQPTKSSAPAAGSFYPGSGGRTYWEPSWNQGQGAWVDIPKTQQEWLAWDQQTGGGEFEGGRSQMNFSNPFRSNPNGTMNPVGSAYNPNAYANWIDDPEMQQRTWFDFMPNLTPERKAQVLESARRGMGTPMAASANKGFAAGGMASMPEYKAGGKLLHGPGDGMSDDIPAVIKGEQPQRAALADGEFVVPADVVSHLGNGSTEAGAKKLYKMMAQIRQARTGKAKQAPRVNTDKFLPRV